MLVSAFATRGLSADVLRLVLTEHDLVTSATVLREVERVLRRKLQVPKDQVAQVLDLLNNSLVATDPRGFWSMQRS